MTKKVTLNTTILQGQTMDCGIVMTEPETNYVKIKHGTQVYEKTGSGTVHTADITYDGHNPVYCYFQWSANVGGYSLRIRRTGAIHIAYAEVIPSTAGGTALVCLGSPHNYETKPVYLEQLYKLGTRSSSFYEPNRKRRSLH